MRARHGVGHGAERNRQVQIGAVLAPCSRQPWPALHSSASTGVPANQSRLHHSTYASCQSRRGVVRLQLYMSPDLSGFKQPSTRAARKAGAAGPTRHLRSCGRRSAVRRR